MLSPKSNIPFDNPYGDLLSRSVLIASGTDSSEVEIVVGTEKGVVVVVRNLIPVGGHEGGVQCTEVSA